MSLENISFKQAHQEFLRHSNGYEEYNSSNKLKKSMLYLNVMMKKAKTDEEKNTLKVEMKNLDELLSKNDLYKDLTIKGLEDLEDISLQFHLANNEYDRLISLGDLNAATPFLRIIMKAATSKIETETIVNIIKTNIKDTEAKLGGAGKP
jgi:hypothetical protein